MTTLIAENVVRVIENTKGWTSKGITGIAAGVIGGASLVLMGIQLQSAPLILIGSSTFTVTMAVLRAMVIHMHFPGGLYGFWASNVIAGNHRTNLREMSQLQKL